MHTPKSQHTTDNSLLITQLYLVGIQDYEQGIVIAYGSFTRLHLFRAKNHHEIVANIVQAASLHLGIDVRVVPSQITLENFEQQRFGQYWYVDVVIVIKLYFLLLLLQEI